jgi:hypothetical protein
MVVVHVPDACWVRTGLTDSTTGAAVLGLALGLALGLGLGLALGLTAGAGTVIGAGPVAWHDPPAVPPKTARRTNPAPK